MTQQLQQWLTYEHWLVMLLVRWTGTCHDCHHTTCTKTTTTQTAKSVNNGYQTLKFIKNFATVCNKLHISSPVKTCWKNAKSTNHWFPKVTTNLGFLNPIIRTTSRFLPCNARSAKRSIAMLSRPSVTLMYHGHTGWTSSKIITQIISLGSSLLGATTSAN